MKESFGRALTELYLHEGGFVDHPKDPGGATNRGITKTRLESEYGRPVSIDELKALPVSESDRIYRQCYWDKVRADELPAGLDYAVFDMAVNSGPYAAAKTLQKVLGEVRDGIIGRQTIAAAKTVPVMQVIADFNAERLKMLTTLDTWKTFGKGWTRRVLEVTQTATLMAEGARG